VGSGSTIIAAERTGRRCAAIEIDPIYAATAIVRWERFTRETAELATDGDAPPADDGVRLLSATVAS